MKKIISSVLFVALFFISCLSLSSCHSCEFSEWVVKKEATCLENGLEVRSCECGETEERTLFATGHSYGEWDVKYEATCTEEGVEIRTCSCGDTEERKIGLANHEYGDWTVVVESTCTEQGVEVRTCSCGDTEERKIDLANHEYGDWTVVVEPTCTETGLELRTCICGNTESKVIDAGHKVNLTLSDDESYYIVTGKGCGHGIIPTEHNGIPVKAIGDRAFYWSNLSEITIPDGIEHIGAQAFGATNLTSVTLPSTLVSIGENCFAHSDYLTSITLPNTVTSIGQGAFFNCTGLKKVEVNDLASYLNINFADADANPLTYAKHLYVNGEEITEIDIKEGTETIKQYAFYNFEALKSLSLPSTLNTVEADAFYNCIGLTKVNIGSLDTWLNIDFLNAAANPVANSGNLYINNELMRELVIEEGITTIKQYIFYNCTNITSISLPSTVTTIEVDAFYNAARSGKVIINSLESWLSIDFANPDANPLNYSQLYLNEQEICELVIPETIENINDYAFFKCSSITSLQVQSGTINVGDYAFYYCHNLTKVTIAESVKNIGARAFENCENLNELNIAEGVETIGDNAFAFCKKLKFVTFPTTVKTIGKDALSYCYGLASVTLPFIGEAVDGTQNTSLEYVIGGYDGHYSTFTNITVTSAHTIYKNAISSWYYLKEITLKEPLQIIQDEAFENCNNLLTITIPNSVTTISKNILKNCDKLNSVKIPYVGQNSSGIGVTCFGYLFGASSYYSQSSSLPSTLKYVTVTGTTTIPDYAFYNCSSLISIDLPKSLEIIGDNAFYGCSNLTGIVIPKNVTAIGKSAFAYCHNLKVVTFKYPYDWYVTRYEGYTWGTSISTTNSSTNANNLRSDYDDYYWYRQNNN